MLKEIRVNLIAFIGLAVVLVSILVPAYSIVSYPVGIPHRYETTLVDIARSNVSGTFNEPLLSVFITLTLVGAVVSVVTPLGGYLLLFGSLSTLFRLPYLYYNRVLVPPPFITRFGLELGPYLAVVGSAIILVSLFSRVVLANKSLRVEYGTGKIMAGLLSVSYGRPFPVLEIRRRGRPTPNPACLVGVLLGVGALFAPWVYIHGTTSSGVSALLGDAFAPLVTPLQVVMLVFVVGLVFSFYTPLAGTILFVSSMSIQVAANGFYTLGPWLGIISSMVIVHSLLMPMRDAEGKSRLAISENLKTFR